MRWCQNRHQLKSPVWSEPPSRATASMSVWVSCPSFSCVHTITASCPSKKQNRCPPGLPGPCAHVPSPPHVEPSQRPTSFGLPGRSRASIASYAFVSEDELGYVKISQRSGEKTVEPVGGRHAAAWSAPAGGASSLHPIHSGFGTISSRGWSPRAVVVAVWVGAVGGTIAGGCATVDGCDAAVWAAPAPVAATAEAPSPPRLPESTVSPAGGLAAGESMVSSLRAVSDASARSAAARARGDSYRESRDFVIAFCMISSISGGRSGRFSVTDGGGSSRCAYMSATSESRSYARAPVRHS